MADYSKGVIYTIRYHNDSSLIYVGSTIQPLSKRWYAHKISCFNEKSKEYNMNLYQKIRETNDLQNWFIELYENYPCSSKQELNKREGEVIREIGNLNSVIAGRTMKQYYEENKNIINEYKKEWYEKNKDVINEKIICECGGCYTRIHKERHFKSKKHQDYLLNNPPTL